MIKSEGRFRLSSASLQCVLGRILVVLIQRVATLLGSFEPLLILVMGGLGLLIVIAILLPTFDLNQLVK